MEIIWLLIAGLLLGGIYSVFSACRTVIIVVPNLSPTAVSGAFHVYTQGLRRQHLLAGWVSFLLAVLLWFSAPGPMASFGLLVGAGVSSLSNLAAVGAWHRVHSHNPAGEYGRPAISAGRMCAGITVQSIGLALLGISCVLAAWSAAHPGRALLDGIVSLAFASLLMGWTHSIWRPSQKSVFSLVLYPGNEIESSQADIVGDIWTFVGVVSGFLAGLLGLVAGGLAFYFVVNT